MSAAPVRFATSGSTGPPVRWSRDEDQLAAETRLLATLLGGDAVDAVHTHAPVEHLYGHLLGVRLPALLGVGVRHVPITRPFAASGSPLLVTLPASFSVLARSLPALDGCDRVTLVFSSARIPPLAHTVVTALGDRARLVELFGSTETGLVATRVFPGGADWELAPDVRFAPGLLAAGSGRLALRSPRIAARDGSPPPAEITLDDDITVVGARSFRWHGRAAGLVKINGRRLSLDAVRATLAAAVPGAVLRCVPEPDPVRGEWFTVTVDRADPRTLRSLAAAVAELPAWQRPRSINPVPAARADRVRTDEEPRTR
ncbi:acyl-coenzyme A synthetase/AMP-(fatty) acid ligase [Actinokineospora baliensis]|uniref:hypothetical protein n=1 Tax=Actinokineospora baliensis TaxID=547056 RepID=UPI0019578681|nr:hypothetical protein [Actinokineospora baliensis]MBM7774783.1 acyl-coenzyme A synthetase/AMP-(fatty) acid ligase [Actinokineospora baliensis]